MSISKRFGAFAAIGLAGVGALVLAPIGGGAASPAPINVSNDRVTCTTMYGGWKFAPPLGAPGPAAAMVSTVKFTLDGCTDLDNPSVKLTKSSLAGTVTFASNTPLALAGISNVTGTLTATWKTAPGQPKLSAPTSTITFTQINGGAVSPGGNFSDTYASLQIGANAAHGNTTQPTVTGNFTGGNSGHTTVFDALGSQSVTALVGPSLLGSGKGVKQLNIGIGQVTVA